ncbi:MAG: hypothetical protein QOG13_2598 [Sphingomonadales bacterium]|jgi:hypothetical protein|nr:hypothetical protein [Sphingomonadales bacterium]
MEGICKFCGQVAELRESHILPAFVYRWLRARSGSGHIRDTENPNLRVQDGLKLHWLCNECEGLFSRFETAFATKVFHPWHKGNHHIEYREWLLKFCVSVSWRVLEYALAHGRGHDYSDEQRKLLVKAEQRWKAFLKGQAPHPGKFEQHLLIFDLVESTTITDLPQNFNRFMMGAVTLDIVGSERSMMTYAKLGRFTIFGMIQKGPNEWDGTKVHVNHGTLRAGKTVLPNGLLDLFREKAALASGATEAMSPTQRSKVDAHVRKNLDQFLASEQFASIAADARMFGKDAVVYRDDT